jgi:hypothetical protein
MAGGSLMVAVGDLHTAESFPDILRQTRERAVSQGERPVLRNAPVLYIGDLRLGEVSTRSMTKQRDASLVRHPLTSRACP